MNTAKLTIPALVFFTLTLLFTGYTKGNILLFQGNDDSLVHRTDNYIQYVNGIAAHGTRFLKTYLKISGHKKFRLITDLRAWPDSLEETVNVVMYNNEPVEYAETPLDVSGGANLEFDNYYYKGKLMAYRIFQVMNKSECTSGTLTNTTTAYYDSTGRIIKTLHIVYGSNNQPIDTARCIMPLNDFSHLYKSYSESPLVKNGIEPIMK